MQGLPIFYEQDHQLRGFSGPTIFLVVLTTTLVNLETFFTLMMCFHIINFVKTQHGWLLISTSKVWSTVKIRGTRVPQKAIVPVGRPRPYSIIILNMHFIPKASLRASSQITASSYILERHLWVNNLKLLALVPTWSLACKQTDCITAGMLKLLNPKLVLTPSKHKTFVWLYAMLNQRRRRWAGVV